MLSYLTLATVASVSKLLFIKVANELVVHNKERFINLWMDRSRPLITISNHRSNIDDPLMWSFITTPEMWRNIDRHRYTLAAHNICFTKPLHTRFFSLGRCVPCVRGEGVYQKGMDFCVDKLNENGWVHMFPEGRVTMEPLRVCAYHQERYWLSNDNDQLFEDEVFETFKPGLLNHQKITEKKCCLVLTKFMFKWGVGRLVEDAVVPPVILPIWCTNMSSVWPLHPPYYPRFGHKVDIHIGELLDSKVILDELSLKNGWSVAKRRKFITDVLQTELFKLGEAVGNLTKGTADRILKENSGENP